MSSAIGPAAFLATTFDVVDEGRDSNGSKVVAARTVWFFSILECFIEEDSFKSRFIVVTVFGLYFSCSIPVVDVVEVCNFSGEDGGVIKFLGFGINSSKDIVSIVKISLVSVISIRRIWPDDSQPWLKWYRAEDL